MLPHYGYTQAKPPEHLWVEPVRLGCLKLVMHLLLRLPLLLSLNLAMVLLAVAQRPLIPAVIPAVIHLPMGILMAMPPRPPFPDTVSHFNSELKYLG